MGLRIDIVTIFPEYFDSPLRVSLIGKAAARGDIEFGVHDLRSWATDVHHSVDDVPFGGGPGMVMKPDVWGDALDEILAGSPRARLVVPTPSGVPFTQDLAARYAAEPWLVFACGRYEGIDGRVVEAMRTAAAGRRGEHRRLRAGRRRGRGPGHGGGRRAAAARRARQRVLRHGRLVRRRTRTPPCAGCWRARLHQAARPGGGCEVPEVLLSGHHAAIARWRRDMALRRTAAHRPTSSRPLRDLDRRDRQVLAEAGWPAEEAPGLAFRLAVEDMAH